MSKTFLQIIAIALGYVLGFMMLDGLTGQNTDFNFMGAMLVAFIIVWSKDRDEKTKEQQK